MALLEMVAIFVLIYIAVIAPAIVCIAYIADADRRRGQL